MLLLLSVNARMKISPFDTDIMAGRGNSANRCRAEEEAGAKQHAERTTEETGHQH
jgi:hypothetical protein